MAPSIDGTGPEPGPDAGIDELQADIERTRRELGDTVSALAEKADVKGRVQDKAVETREAAIQKAQVVQEAVKRNPAIDIGVLVAIAIGITIWARRRNR